MASAVLPLLTSPDKSRGFSLFGSPMPCDSNPLTRGEGAHQAQKEYKAHSKHRLQPSLGAPKVSAEWSGEQTMGEPDRWKHPLLSRRLAVCVSMGLHSLPYRGKKKKKPSSLFRRITSFIATLFRQQAILFPVSRSRPMVHVWYASTMTDSQTPDLSS